MEKEIKTRISNKIDTTSNWEETDPDVLSGEIHVFSDSHKIKVGSGGNLSSIPYLRVDYTDVDGLSARMDNKISFSDSDPNQLVIIDGTDDSLLSLTNEPLGPTPEIRLVSIRGRHSKDFYTEPMDQYSLGFAGIPFGYVDSNFVVRFTFEVIRGSIAPTDRFEICRMCSTKTHGGGKQYRLRCERFLRFPINTHTDTSGRLFFTVAVPANVAADSDDFKFTDESNALFKMIAHRDSKGSDGAVFFCRIRRVSPECPDPDDFAVDGSSEGAANSYFLDFSNTIRVKGKIGENSQREDTEDGYNSILFKF